MKPPEASLSCSEITTSVPNEGSQSQPFTPASFADYSDLFGDEFKIPEYMWDSIFTNVLDIGLVEEGILHVLYACASQVNHSQSFLLQTNQRSHMCTNTSCFF